MRFVLWFEEFTAVFADRMPMSALFLCSLSCCFDWLVLCHPVQRPAMTMSTFSPVGLIDSID